METLVANMTKEEFIQTIELIVERKLQEMFDSLEEMELKPEVKERLLHQQQLVSEGEHGRGFADYTKERGQWLGNPSLEEIEAEIQVMRQSWPQSG